MARSMTIDKGAGTFAALRFSNFRIYFFGQLVSTSGNWMQNVALGYLVFNLTQSELWLGIVACAAGLPMLIIGAFAGVIIEHLPRRRVLMFTQVCQMILAFILAFLVFTEAVQVWHIVALALTLGTVTAFDAPSRQTIISDLVSSEHLASGIALNSIIVNGSRVLGPTVAGVMLAMYGPAWCFFFNGVGFLVVIFTMFLLHLDEKIAPHTSTTALTQLTDGLRYVRQHAVIFPLLLLAMVGAFFCWSTISLYPAFADVVLKSPSEGYAMISAANGAGAVIAGLTVSTLGRRFGRGRVLTIGGILTALSVILLAQTRSVPAAAFASVLSGFCSVAFFVTVNTSIQLVIPNEFRGRVLSLYTLSIIGIHPIGALFLGFLADSTSSPTALTVYGGCMAFLAALILYRFPNVREIAETQANA